MTARPEPVPVSRDPLPWCWLITGAFLALVLHRLSIPSKEYFDEIHYLPAARNLLALSEARNIEHPMLGKELIALAIQLCGDTPFGWRIGSALSGTVALFAAMRATWWASLSRPATILAGLLLASNFVLFMIARIAMLDPYMLAFALLALWFCAHGLRNPAAGRRDMVLAGVALGLSLASKWSVLPILALCSDEAGQSLPGLSPEQDDRLMDEAADLIPKCVIEIAAFWRGKSLRPISMSPVAGLTAEPMRATTKVGRNEPCPCSSGKKFKKCCGKSV